MATRHWFITGTSSGIGRALTEHALERGDSVVATLRKPDALQTLERRHGARLKTMVLDVTDGAAVRQTVSRAFLELDRIDVVVSNAGYGLFGAAEELADEQIRHQVDTNLIGSIQVIRAALPQLHAQGGGRIVQISSEGGQVAYPNFSVYHATKWGIEGFVEAVAQEVASFNIQFTLVEPGPAKTNFRSGMVSSPAMAAYDQTASGELRRSIASGTFALRGDPQKMARAVFDSVMQSPAPKRLALGGDTYARIRASLEDRLAVLDAQKAIALSTDS